MDYLLRRKQRWLIQDLVELELVEDLQRQREYILRVLERSPYDSNDKDNRNNQHQKKEYCLVKVIYQNSNTRQRRYIDEITIIQNNRTRFKGCLQDKDEFKFKLKHSQNDSRLKLKFYVNDLLEDEMTACCEHNLINRNRYHHLFQIKDIIGAKRCYDCEFNYDNNHDSKSSDSTASSAEEEHCPTKTKTRSSTSLSSKQSEAQIAKSNESVPFIVETQKNEGDECFPMDITKADDYRTEFNDPFNNQHQSDDDSRTGREFSPEPIYDSSIPNIDVNARWAKCGITVAGGNGSGYELDQFIQPWGFYLDTDQTLYIAELRGHRVMEWKPNATIGRVVAGGNGEGNRTDELDLPVCVTIDKDTSSLIIADCGNQRVIRWFLPNSINGEVIVSNINCWGIAMDNLGYLYVTDQSESAVKRFRIGERNGIIVAGGNGKGNRINQLDRPTHIFIDQDQSIYVSDSGNDRVMKWVKGAAEGVVVAGGYGQGDDLTQLSNPRGIFVDQCGTVYVSDHWNHRIMRWQKGVTHGNIIVGGNGSGAEPDQLSYPFDLSLDQYGNLYVVDEWNSRVQRFDIERS